MKPKASGLKPPMGNRGYCKYLNAGVRATINQKPVEEARYSGKYALETNCDLATEEVARAYKGLWHVERALHGLKSPWT